MPAGRPKIGIDLDDLEGLMHLQPTDEEIAAHFNVSPQTIRRRKKEDPEFCRVLEKGRGLGRVSLRRRQKQILDNDKCPAQACTMAIWLGKQMLGQRDKHDIDQKIEAQVKRFEVVAVDPDPPAESGDDAAG